MKKKEKILSVSTAALVGLSSIMPASTASAIAAGENTVKPSISVNVSEPSSYLNNKWGTAKWDIEISDDTGLAQFVIKSNDQILSKKTYEANTLTDTIHYEMTKEQYEKAKKNDGLLEITFEVKDIDGNIEVYEGTYKTDLEVKDPEITGLNEIGIYKTMPDIVIKNIDENNDDAEIDVSKAKIEAEISSGGTVIDTLSTTETELKLEKSIFPSDKTEFDIKIIVTDEAGNTKTVTKKIIIDATAPLIENVTIDLVNGWAKAGSNISAKISDNHNGLTWELKDNKEDKVITKGEVNEAESNLSIPINETTEGDQEYTLTVKDKAGNEATETLSFKADTHVPEITNFALTEDKTYNAFPDFKVEASDHKEGSALHDGTLLNGGSMLVTIENITTGEFHTVTENNVKELTVLRDNLEDLKDGEYKINVAVADAAGNSVTEQKSIIVDSKAPSIENVLLSGNQSNNWFNGDVTLNFDALDLQTVKKVKVTLNGEEILKEDVNNATYHGSLNLSKEDLIAADKNNGEFEIVIEATDNAENTAKTVKTFKADFVAPKISLSGVNEGSFNQVVKKVDITTTDKHISEQGFKIYVTVNKDGVDKEYIYDGAEDIIIEGDNFADSGIYKVSAYAIDAAGNRSETKEINFTVDNIAPEIKDIVNDGHLSAFGWYNSEIETSFNITDNMKNITDIKVDVNGKEVFTKEYEGTDKEELSFKLSKEDIKSLVDSKDYLSYTFKVTDKAGNVSTKTQSLKADFIAPVSNITGVKEGSFNKQVTDVIIDTQDAHITENGAKVYVTISKDGKNETFTFEGASKIKLDDKYFTDSAKYKITTYAVDAADNRGEEKSVSFVVDNIAPTISNIKNSGHLSNKNWYNTAITTDFEISDNMKNIVSAKVTVNNKTVLSEKYSDMVQKDSLSVTLSKSRIEELVNDNGTLNYEFIVTDAAGNVTVKEQSLRADFTAPVLTINGINEGTHYQSLPSISVDNNEKFFKDSEFTVKIERDGKLVSTKTFEGLADALINAQYFGNDGDYVITVTGKDGADNVAKGDKISFVKDTTAPELNISGIENGTFNPNPVTLTFTASERYYDTTNVTIHVKRTLGGSVNEYTTNFNMDRVTDTTTLNFSETGTYEIYMTAIDEAGNEAVSRTATFTVDTANPFIDISAPTIVTYGESSAITISATDDYLDNVSVVLYKDGQQVRAESSASGAITFENLAQTRDNDGRYNFTVTATDKAGNVTTEERDFIVNRFGAKYTTNAFDDNLVGYHKELPKALIIDANSPSDIVSGAVNVKRDGESINVGSVKSNRTNMEFEITPEDVSKEGIYFVTATATDNVGNISNSEDQIGDIRFVIDKTKPTISHNIEDEVYKASSKEFDIAFKDNILLKNATIKVNGKVVEEFKDIDSTSLNYTLTLNKGIKQKVEIETEDMAGNIKTTTNKVTVSDSMFDYLLYNHTLYWIIGGIATLGIAGLIFALKRRKDKK